MAKLILMDEFHITAFAPQRLTAAEFAAIRQALDERRFQTHLRRVVRVAFRRHRGLHQIRVQLSR